MSRFIFEIRSNKKPLIEVKKPDVLEAIVNKIAFEIGMSPNDVDPDANVSQDLNISKSKFVKILHYLAEHIKVDIHVDIDPLIKRTIRQISSVIERLYKEQHDSAFLLAKTHRKPWTREFHLSMVPKPPPKPVKEKKRREDNWQNAHALVLVDSINDKIGNKIKTKLTVLGARVELKTYADAINQNLMERGIYSHFFSIMPNNMDISQSGFTDIDFQDIVTRLFGMAKVASASIAPRRRNTVTYLQFGGGYFGTNPETAVLNQCGATALAASIHQERSDLRVRVLDFSPALSASDIIDKTIQETTTPDAFAAVGYDANLSRHERFQRLIKPETYKTRSFTWTKEDVILVTGGAKGITSECALGVARACGARMALVGRTPLVNPGKEKIETNEILTALKKYSSQNLIAEYFCCDISDRKAVQRLIQEIRKKMGPATGVIHGAGINTPKTAIQVSINEAIQEVSPKVLGALNLIATLDHDRLKLFVGMTSIIGVTGMPGNAWYGFSNEALDIVLRRFQASQTNTRTLSVAYSIWQDIGMGARMGSVNVLENQGISAIPAKEGVDRFVRLFFNDPGVHQVIVAARLSGLDTWEIEPKSTIDNARFLEVPLHITPGVESAFRVHLTLEKDLYLQDHRFEGTYLFPAVFGLEAMAQAVAHVSGIVDFSRVRIENILLTHPITIDIQSGTDILVWAEVEVQISDSALTIVRAGIYQPGIGDELDSFSATFILGLNKNPPNHQIRLPKKPLPIVPHSDLYRKTWLFQGKRF